MQLGPVMTGYATVNQRRFDGRVAFHLEYMQNGPTATNCKVELYNLSPASRNWVEANSGNKKVVSVFGGYNGDNRLIFQAEYYAPQTERDGTELKTTLACIHGLSLWQSAHIEPSGARSDADIYASVLGVLSSYGIVQGHYSASVKAALQKRTYKRPAAISGLVRHVLDDLVNRHHLGYGVENGALNIYDPKAYEDQDEFLLTKDTGLIGFPSRSSNDAGGVYKITSLFNPELTAGRKVLVKSVAFGNANAVDTQGLGPFQDKGTELKIWSLIHTGDTWRGQGKTEMECVRLGSRGFLVAG